MSKIKDTYKRRIVLVGPPGVGKSTLVDLAKSKGITAIDMEEYGPKRQDRVIRLQEILQTLDENPVIFGGADIGSEFPSDFERILLLPPRHIYLERFQTRNDAKPEKAYQKGEEIYDWFLENHNNLERGYDRVIDSTGIPEETLDEILKSS